jgi:hypothetical protein
MGSPQGREGLRGKKRLRERMGISKRWKESQERRQVRTKAARARTM